MMVEVLPWVLLGAAAGGALVGALVGGRLRQQRILEEERIGGREARIRELVAELASAREELGSLRETAHREGERRSAAEARASRVDELEAEVDEREAQLASAQRERGEHLKRIAQLETRMEDERRSLQEQVAMLAEARENLTESFRSLSSQALAESNRSFLDLARETLERYQSQARTELEGRKQAVEHLVSPIRESLSKVDEQLRGLETARREAYVGLRQQIEGLSQSQSDLRSETQRLSQALRAPNVRGRWGEIQLRRVVEIAGMLPHTDFVEQTQVPGEEGRLRPDLIVLLPGGKTIVVDAKAPLKGYLEAMDAADDETRDRRMRRHAAQLRQHMDRLGAKGYADQLDTAPEFVVLFLPGESFFSAALEKDPVLIEDGVRNGVILATPTTLIALLRAVAYGWRQERLAESAQVVSQLGRELYDRLRTMSEHLDRLGRRLGSAVQSYNQTVGSYQSRVLVSARRFEELGVPSGREIPALDPVDVGPRELAGWIETGDEGDEASTDPPDSGEP